MTFDPFGDFETRGYLRNFEKEKDPEIVRRLQHTAFTLGLDAAFKYLAGRKWLEYGDVLKAHQILFEAFYPWAGQDRLKTAPGLIVKKGDVIFAAPTEIRLAIDFALLNGQDKAFMTARPGEVMGYLAFGHPFLDGNGRVIMTVHAIMAQRAGFSFDWSKTSKDDYLAALSQEIETPGKGILDGYLKPFVRGPVAYEKLAESVAGTPGIDGGNVATNAVLGDAADPSVKARYEAVVAKRRHAEDE
ncbi:MAG: Fic family protein [Mesorhizobium sp.]|uniref:Fic family protein n=1 Tax=Mesorhizobium sp. TaxID=1871066 RepID=UPI001ACD0460|nr:Fic family protein [Mesorhizobium sp.]MBN9219003.1 Fic family protein [Mesorhizobium sp.]